MKEATKSTVLRVFQTAQCSSARYIWGVACSAASILLSGLPFYTVYRIVRIFLEASLNDTAVDVSAACVWAGITWQASSLASRFRSPAASSATPAPSMRSMACVCVSSITWAGWTWASSRAGSPAQYKGHERQHRENGKHYCPRCIEPHWRRPFAGLPVGAAVLHQCTARLDDRCRVGACVHHSVFGFWREAGAEDLDGSQPLIYGNGRGIFRVCVRDGRRKDLWQAGGRGFAADQLDRKKIEKT